MDGIWQATQSEVGQVGNPLPTLLPLPHCPRAYAQCQSVVAWSEVGAGVVISGFAREAGNPIF